MYKRQSIDIECYSIIENGPAAINPPFGLGSVEYNELFDRENRGEVTIDSSSILEARVVPVPELPEESFLQDGVCGAARTTDAGLLPLADNGGDTMTHALSESSIAINTGNILTCLETDQRDAERDQLCDVGLFEFGASVPIAPPESDDCLLYTSPSPRD